MSVDKQKSANKAQTNESDDTAAQIRAIVLDANDDDDDDDREDSVSSKARIPVDQTIATVNQVLVDSVKSLSAERDGFLWYVIELFVL